MATSLELVLDRLHIDVSKHGNRWFARCPFPDHPDRDPSWCIHGDGDRKGSWRCFGCGRHGKDVTSLVMQLHDVDYATARAWVSGYDTLESTVDVVSSSPLLRSMHLFALPNGVQHRPLSQWVATARTYVEQRGVTQEQITRWSIGYAIHGLLAGRIVVPVYSLAGTLSGYTARSFWDDDKRYLEANAKDGADLSVMFGEQHWSDDRSFLFATEGVFNALAVERATTTCEAEFEGHPVNMVAFRGNAFSIDARRLLKLSSFGTIMCVSDPDAAGDELWRFLQFNLARHCTLRRVSLPRGKDANAVPTELLVNAILDAA